MHHGHYIEGHIVWITLLFNWKSISLTTDLNAGKKLIRGYYMWNCTWSGIVGGVIFEWYTYNIATFPLHVECSMWWQKNGTKHIPFDLLNNDSILILINMWSMVITGIKNMFVGISLWSYSLEYNTSTLAICVWIQLWFGWFVLFF